MVKRCGNSTRITYTGLALCGLGIVAEATARHLSTNGLPSIEGSTMNVAIDRNCPRREARLGFAGLENICARLHHVNY